MLYSEAYERGFIDGMRAGKMTNVTNLIVYGTIALAVDYVIMKSAWEYAEQKIFKKNNN